MRPFLRVLLTIVCFLPFSAFAHAQTGPEQIDVRPYAPTQGSSFEQVSLMNGSLSMHIPVWSFHQRGKVKLDFWLAYDNPTFELSVQCFPSPGTNFCPVGNAPCKTDNHVICTGGYEVADSPGEATLGLQLGTHLASSTDFAIELVDQSYPNGLQEAYWNLQTPDMGIHALQAINASGQQWRTYDGTGWLYDATTCTLRDNEGTRYVFNCEANNNYPINLLGGHQAGTLAYMEDNNGNRVTVTYGSNGRTWTDTENRTITDPTQSSAMDSRCPTGSTGSSNFQIPGISSPVVLCNGQFIYSTHYFFNEWATDGGYSEAQGSLPTLSGLILPDGEQWGFIYTPQPGDGEYGTPYSYGELKRINLPTGGAIQYSWQTSTSACGNPNINGQISLYRRGVYQKKESADGVFFNNPWTYLASAMPSSGASYTVTVTDPLLNRQIHQLTDVANAGYCDYFDTRTDYEDQNGTLLKTEETDYVPFSSLTIPQADSSALPVASRTMWPDGSTKGSITSYDSGYTVTDNSGNSAQYPFGLKSGSQEFDYGTSSGQVGSLLRSRVTTYWWQSNSSALAYNILNTPANTTVTDASTGAQQITLYGYDETGITSGNLAPGTNIWNASPPNGNVRGNQTSVSHYWNTTGGYLVTHVGYTNTGLISSITMPHDANTPDDVTSYDYSATYQGALLTTKTDALGATNTYTYTSLTDQTLSATDPNQATTTYEYYDDTRLHKIILPANAQGLQGETEYRYPTTTEVDSRTEQNSGVWVSHRDLYDGLGRKIQSIAVGGCDLGGDLTNEVIYDALSRPVSETNPHCTSTNAANSSTNGTTWHGDTSGSNGYDAIGRPLLLTHPDGTFQTWAYTDETTTFVDETRTATWQRTNDALGRLHQVLEPDPTSGVPTLPTTYTYDAFNNLTYVDQQGASGDTARTRSFSYDSLNRLLTSMNPETGTLTYTYDNHGNLRTKTDARKVRTTYSYNALNQLLGKAYSAPTGDPNATAIAARTLPVNFTYGTPGTTVANGVERLISEQTGPSGSPTTQHNITDYDALGHVRADSQCAVAQLCGSAPYAMHYEYDLAGNIKSSTNGLTDGASHPGIWVNYTYDAANHLNTVMGTWDADPNGGLARTLFAPTDTVEQYGPAGLLAASYGVYNGVPDPTLTQIRTYDNRLRVTSETDFASGNSTSATASHGTITVSGVETQSASPGTPGSGYITIQGGDGTHTACTPAPHPHCLPVPDSGTFTITLAQGTPQEFVAQVDFDGDLSSDLVTKLTTALSDNTSGTPLVNPTSADCGIYGTDCTILYMTALGPGLATNYTVDISVVDNDNPSDDGSDYPSTLSGATLTGGTDSGQIVYDAGTVSLGINGNTATVASSWSGSSSTTSTTDSIADDLMSVLVANGMTASASTNTSGPTPVTTITVSTTATGAAMNWTMACPYADTAGLSPSFTVSCTGMTGGADAYPGGLVYSYSIPASGPGVGYAPNSDLLSMTDSVMGTWSYQYDKLNRLVQGTASANPGTIYAPYGTGVLSWGYDSFGNYKGQGFTGSGGLAQVNQANYYYTGTSTINGAPSGSPTNNRIDGVDYDASGNTNSVAGKAVTYDAEGRVDSVGGQTFYVYDAEGRRVAKASSSGVTNLYLVSLSGAQVTELDGSGTWLHSNVSAGLELATYDSAGLHFHFTDALGTRRVQVSGTGALEESCQSLPFGDSLNCFNPTGAAITAGAGGADTAEQHFTGKEHDAESGLDYFGARYLNGNIGRFMSPDWSAKAEPIPYAKLDNPQSFNLYAYVGNNPLSGVDPDGHLAFPISNGKGSMCMDHVCQSGDNEDVDINLTGGFGAPPQPSQPPAQQSPGTIVTNGIGVSFCVGGPCDDPNAPPPAQQQGGEGSSSNIDKRNALADAAYGEAKGKSTAWAQGNGAPKCNVFVCAMLNKAGIGGPTYPGGDNPLVAQDWANPKFHVDNWRVLGPGEAPGAGDVAAYKESFSNATGHSGIVTGNDNGVIHVVAAGSTSIYQTTAGSKYFGQGMVITYRRYTGP